MPRTQKKEKVNQNEEPKQKATNTASAAEKLNQPQASKSPRLCRSETDKVIGGVAAGIAKYLEVDPIIVRLFFLVLLFGAGSGFLIYVALWIILPSENSIQSTSQDVINENVADVKGQAQKIVGDVQGNNSTGKVLFGALVIFVGLLVLFKMFNVYIDLSWIWPVLIIGVGIFIIAKK